jgi:FKBP-type peptidyl-prolyl cis-trans isomerase 2
LPRALAKIIFLFNIILNTRKFGVDNMAKKTGEKVTEKKDKTADKKNTTPKAEDNSGIKTGSNVKIDYVGSLEDGTVFDDSSKHGQPLEFEVGKGMIIPGFEKAIIGMKKGEEKSIHLEPCDAYGDVNPEATKKIPKEHLPKGQEPQVGMVLLINLPNGMQLPARITEVTPTEVTIDLNHPLAGKCLNFKIKVVDIN